jgi:hypothetical protein
MDAIIGVRVVDTDAKSYNSRAPEKVLKSAEKVKKNKYLEHCLQQRRASTPFVISVDEPARIRSQKSVEMTRNPPIRKMDETIFRNVRPS